MTFKDCDTFTRQYIVTALWAETDESTEQGGEPFDKNYGPDDIAPEALAKMAADCAAFQTAHWDDISSDVERAGHDFWLTRNGHGAGFWDGDWPIDVGKRLTLAAHDFGECHLFKGEDGQIYEM